MLWFNFILDLNFVFLCFKLIIIVHNHTHRTTEIKRIKLNHKTYLSTLSESFFFPDPLFSLQCSIMSMCSLKILAQLVGHHGTKINHTTQ